MRVQVHSLIGAYMDLEVYDSDTLGEVKLKISGKARETHLKPISCEVMRLFYVHPPRPLHLDDRLTLAQHGVLDGSHIYIVQRLRAGGGAGGAGGFEGDCAPGTSTNHGGCGGFLGDGGGFPRTPLCTGIKIRRPVGSLNSKPHGNARHPTGMLSGCFDYRRGFNTDGSLPPGQRGANRLVEVATGMDDIRTFSTRSVECMWAKSQRDITSCLEVGAYIERSRKVMVYPCVKWRGCVCLSITPFFLSVV